MRDGYGCDLRNKPPVWCPADCRLYHDGIGCVDDFAGEVGPMTLDEVALVLSEGEHRQVSRERIRQIEARALAKLLKHFDGATRAAKTRKCEICGRAFDSGHYRKSCGSEECQRELRRRSWRAYHARNRERRNEQTRIYMRNAYRRRRA